MKKFEYTTLFFDRNKETDDINIDLDKFNKLGEKGWELVCLINNPKQKIFFFKREVKK